MTYKVESINDCTKKLAFTFEKLDLTQQIEDALKQKQKSSNLKGFRQGKAPLAMVKKVFGNEIETDALNKFVQGELYEAITSEKLNVVGYPSFENMDYKSGESICFDAVVEIFPSVELKDYSSLSFTQDKVEVTNDDIEDAKKNFLNTKAEMVEIKDDSVAVEKGHFTVLNFEGVKEDGVRPENMKGEEFLLEIGSNQFIPGFEDGMLGMKKGEKKEIKVTFPEDYFEDDLKNAPVTFEVELLEIKEKSFPEFTDELAKEMNFESVVDFETKTKENLMKQKERGSLEKLHQEILEKLTEENSFTIPNALLEQQKKHVKEDLAKTLAQQGFGEEMLDEYYTKWDADINQKAEFQVKSGLILDALAKEFSVEANESDLDAKIAETAAMSGIDSEEVKKYYSSNEQIKQNMMYAIREEKTFEALKAKIKIS